MNHSFGVMAKNFFLSPRSGMFSPMLSFKVIVLCFTFKYVIYLSLLIFIKIVRFRFRFFLFVYLHMNIQLLQNNLLKRLFFLH